MGARRVSVRRTTLHGHIAPICTLTRFGPIQIRGCRITAWRDSSGGVLMFGVRPGGVGDPRTSPLGAPLRRAWLTYVSVGRVIWWDLTARRCSEGRPTVIALAVDFWKAYPPPRGCTLRPLRAATARGLLAVPARGCWSGRPTFPGVDPRLPRAQRGELSPGGVGTENLRPPAWRSAPRSPWRLLDCHPVTTPARDAPYLAGNRLVRANRSAEHRGYDPRSLLRCAGASSGLGKSRYRPLVARTIASGRDSPPGSEAPARLGPATEVRTPTNVTCRGRP